MSEPIETIETTLPQDHDQTISSTPNYSLTSRSSSLSSSSDEEVNELSQNTIVNSVSNSNNVHINNSSSNIYNAPVVINNIYRQHVIEQLPTVTTDVLQSSFFKRFYSIILSRVQQYCSTKYHVAVTTVLSLVITLIIILSVWLRDSEQSQNLDSDLSNSAPEPCDLQIVLRKEWNARLRKNVDVPLKSQPPPLVIINHTHTALCYILKQCVMLVQRIQSYHMDDKGWDDIGYNFLVGGDGIVYEGRGWNVEGAHTLSYNNQSIGLALIGTFDKEKPTNIQMKVTQKLIEYGVQNGYINPAYKLLANRQCKPGNDSPGDAFYNVMKSWKHWSYMCPKVLKKV